MLDAWTSLDWHYFLHLLAVFSCSDSASEAADAAGRPGDADEILDASATDASSDANLPDADGILDAAMYANDDGDTVCNDVDECPGEDDQIDIDNNMVADCFENLAENSQFISDVTGWSIASATVVTWLSSDEKGAGSGAIEVNNSQLKQSTTASGCRSKSGLTP